MCVFVYVHVSVCVCVLQHTHLCAPVCSALPLVQIQLHISKFYFGWRMNRASRCFHSQSIRPKWHWHTHTYTHTHTHTHKYCVHFSQCCHGNKSQPFNEMSRHSDQPTYTLILYTEEVLPWWFSDNILRQRVGFQSRQARGKNYYLDHCVFTDHVFLTLLHSGQWFDFYWRKGCRKNRFLNEEKRMNELEMAS